MNLPHSFSTSVDLLPDGFLIGKNVYGKLFYLAWKNCCGSVQWNFILISAAGQKWMWRQFLDPIQGCSVSECMKMSHLWGGPCCMNSLKRASVALSIGRQMIVWFRTAKGCHFLFSVPLNSLLEIIKTWVDSPAWIIFETYCNV